mmetsp:Transcript_19457/g.37569  ORF Transcript_19457/g.37569 Transcript_19457/m.37569 type:complete len:273 (-) Transcript_19457:265-1083(-)
MKRHNRYARTHARTSRTSRTHARTHFIHARTHARTHSALSSNGGGGIGLALMLALDDRWRHGFKTLLKYFHGDPSQNIADHKGENSFSASLLTRAAQCGDMDIVRLLIAKTDAAQHAEDGGVKWCEKNGERRAAEMLRREMLRREAMGVSDHGPDSVSPPMASIEVPTPPSPPEGLEAEAELPGASPEMAGEASDPDKDVLDPDLLPLSAEDVKRANASSEEMDGFQDNDDENQIDSDDADKKNEVIDLGTDSNEEEFSAGGEQMNPDTPAE